MRENIFPFFLSMRGKNIFFYVPHNQILARDLRKRKDRMAFLFKKILKFMVPTFAVFLSCQ